MSELNPARDAWNAAIELLRADGSLSDSQTAIVRMAHPLGHADNIFMVVVGSDFLKGHIEDKISGMLNDMLSNILGRRIQLSISVDPSVNEVAPQPTTPVQQFQPTTPSYSVPVEPVDVVDHDSYASSEADVAFGPETTRYVNQTTEPSETSSAKFLSRAKDARLNPRYSFDNFVIAKNNNFAAATSLSVAESPGTTYNPLFLYSDSGMGKTHLMHAIGNYALSLFPEHNVRYVSSEEFMNAFINSIRDKRQAEFKDQFRNVDILLIDDIQFIGGQDSTMEEFFHTFNALTNTNKQIVITSDVAPNLLNGFEDRLISRFEQGLSIEIDRPDLETRIAILNKKAQTDGFEVPRDVTEYIASHMTTNVREMEGALRRVTAYADLSKQALTLPMAEMILKDIIANPDSVEITPSLIMGQTADYFNITLDEMTSSDRSRVLVTARQVAMYLCRDMTELSLPKIGDIFGKRDHTTVMHACRKIEKQMAERQTTYNQVSELTSRIKQAATQANM